MRACKLLSEPSLGVGLKALPPDKTMAFDSGDSKRVRSKRLEHCAKLHKHTDTQTHMHMYIYLCIYGTRTHTVTHTHTQFLTFRLEGLAAKGAAREILAMAMQSSASISEGKGIRHSSTHAAEPWQSESQRVRESESQRVRESESQRVRELEVGRRWRCGAKDQTVLEGVGATSLRFKGKTGKEVKSCVGVDQDKKLWHGREAAAAAWRDLSLGCWAAPRECLRRRSASTWRPSRRDGLYRTRR